MYVCLFMCVRNSIFTIIDSDNGLSPGRHQAIIWTNVGILLIQILGTNFSEILSEIHIFSFKEMHLKILGTNFSEILSEIHIFSFKEMHLKMSAKWWQFRLGLNVLIATGNYATNRHNCGCRCTDRSSPITKVVSEKATNWHTCGCRCSDQLSPANVVTERTINLLQCCDRDEDQFISLSCT